VSDAASTAPTSPGPPLGRDFAVFCAGQALSNFGNAVTFLLLPLIVFRLTGSALNLGITSAAEFVPYLLFGLIIGAYVDRLPRRALMIVTDIARAALIASIPLLAALGVLQVWWIYVAAFVGSTLGIGFNTAEFTAIPSLVNRENLVAANGRVQAIYSGSQVIGPLVAGALLALLTPANVLLLDAGSFLASAASLAILRTGFDPAEKRAPSRVMDDVKEGLRYVLHHPVLRNISLMMAIINLLTSTTFAELVFFAKHRLDASDTQVGWLFAAGSVGTVVCGLLAGRLRGRWSFSRVALGSLVVDGLACVAFAFTRNYVVALALWSVYAGVGILFNINTGSLRQTIVPPEMLGRVMSIASVLAWSAIPVGTTVGGYVIASTGNVEAVYAVLGAASVVVALAFSRTALGHAERYIPEEAVLPHAQKATS
jgi:MFS family permease